jgi:hypothetical protein
VLPPGLGEGRCQRSDRFLSGATGSLIPALAAFLMTPG